MTEKQRKPLTANEVNKAYETAKAEYELEMQAYQDRQDNKTKLERWQANIIDSSDFLAKLADVFYLGFVNVLSSLGIGIIWLLAVLAEIASVYEGFAALHNEIWIAALLASILVFSVQFLEFTIQDIEQKSDWKNNPNSKFTVKVWFKNLWAFITGNETQDTPARGARNLQAIAMIAVVIFAFVGSSHDIVTQYDGVWYHAYLSIFTRSSAEQFNIWIMVIIRAILFVTMARIFTENMIKKSHGVAIQRTDDKPNFDYLFKKQRAVLAENKYQVSLAKVANQSIIIEDNTDRFVQDIPIKTDNKNGQKRTTKTDMTKTDTLQSICACGCGEIVISQSGRKPKKFFNDACRKRYKRTKTDS